MPYKVKIPSLIRTDSLDKLGESVVNLSKWAEDELSAVASSLLDTEPDFIWNSVPPKPRRGTYAYADGTNWNPGYGEGAYTYNGTLWMPCRGDLLWNTSLTNLTAAQLAQLKTNLGLGYKNRFTNGGMQISQENGASSSTAVGYYPVDMFSVNGSTTGSFSSAQVASLTPGGSPNRLRVTVNTADTSIAAGESLYIRHAIEGSRIPDFKFGTSSAAPITVQFGARTNVAGTYSFSLWNGATNRCYIKEYTLAAGVDTLISFTIPGDQTGTWSTGNAAGIYAFWPLMAGSNYQGAVGNWQAVVNSSIASSNQTNWMGTAGNTFELFDVTMDKGTAAIPFTLPDLATELPICQRYWEKSIDYGTALGLTGLGDNIFFGGLANGANQAGWSTRFKVQKRAAPTVTVYAYDSGASGKIYDAGGANDITASVDMISDSSFRCYGTASVASTVIARYFYWKADARM